MAISVGLLQETAREIQCLLALHEHAYQRVEVPTDDAAARRLCDDVLLNNPTRPCTTTELAMARFLLLRLGPHGTRDSDEQRAFDMIAEYLRARDAMEDTTALVLLMPRSNHPIIAEFLAATRECRDANAITPVDEAARAQAAKRAAHAVAEMRQALADHRAAFGMPPSAGPYRLPMVEWDGQTDTPVANSAGRAMFAECAECAGKPGAPSLCNACLHNRGIADELHRVFAAAFAVNELRLTIKSRIDHRDRNAIRHLATVVDDMIRRGWSP